MNIRWYLLGTGSAVPIGRGLPCNVLKVDGDYYVFDCGEGCQERMFRMGLSIVKTRAVFITHLHGDHFFGLYGMIQSMSMLERREPLYIIAPSQLRELLANVAATTSSGFYVEFIPVKPYTILYSDGRISVEAFPVDHNIEAYGYSISIPRKTVVKKIVYTGDTRPVDTVLDASQGVDLLVHEATFTSSMREEAYKQGHSTALDAALIARKACARKLVLTHISSRYEDGYELYIDAYRFFNNVVVGEDYMVVFP